MRLIGADGINVGVVTMEEAFEAARTADLDLVEIAPNADPPVCRVLDFGKFLYEKSKKDRESRKAQTKVEIKEVRLRPKTSEHHRSFKVRNARRWLLEGKKVRVDGLNFGKISAGGSGLINHSLHDCAIAEVVFSKLTCHIP